MTFGNAQFQPELPQTPNLLHRYPDAAPDRGVLQIPFIQETADSPRRDVKIDSYLVQPIVALQEQWTYRGYLLITKRNLLPNRIGAKYRLQ
jgi:hypothetical protein